VLNARTARFCAELAADFSRVGLPVEVVSHASMFWLHTRTGAPVRRVDGIPASQSAWYGRLFHAALARGVYLPPSGFEVSFLSMAHDDEILGEARAALAASAQEAGQP
jgi:glutamate-1-semialdehyde 2,1-aminomutase